MATSRLEGVIRHLRRVALPHDGGGLTDGQLLERFRDARESAAFEALLRRHGPMVLGVCRRVLRHEQDAEDAFQATFLVLVHKAESVAARESVGSWLHGVAHRTAQKARAAAARRRAKERRMARPEGLPEHDDRWRELRPLIDQELSRLPDRYREAIVLCDLEGRTRKEAARRLGCPEGTVSGRLARARALLGKRLARRGLGLGGGAVVATLARNASAAAPAAPLVGSTVKAAALIAAGHTAAGVVSAPVAALTEGVLQTMCVSKVKLVLVAALLVGLSGAGWGVYRVSAAPRQETVKAAPAVATPGKQEDEPVNLPQGPAPVQVLAGIAPDGKLVIKTTAKFGIKGLGAAGKGGDAPGRVVTHTFDFEDVQVIDTKGRQLDPKEVARRLRDETVALASPKGQPVDPLHLRVLRDDVLIFLLPATKVVPAVAIPVKAVPLGPVQVVPLPPLRKVPGGVGPVGEVRPPGEFQKGDLIKPVPAPPK